MNCEPNCSALLRRRPSSSFPPCTGRDGPLLRRLRGEDRHGRPRGRRRPNVPTVPQREPVANRQVCGGRGGWRGPGCGGGGVERRRGRGVRGDGRHPHARLDVPVWREEQLLRSRRDISILCRRGWAFPLSAAGAGHDRKHQDGRPCGHASLGVPGPLAFRSTGAVRAAAKPPFGVPRPALCTRLGLGHAPTRGSPALAAALHPPPCAQASPIHTPAQLQAWSPPSCFCRLGDARWRPRLGDAATSTCGRYRCCSKKAAPNLRRSSSGAR